MKEKSTARGMHTAASLHNENISHSVPLQP